MSGGGYRVGGRRKRSGAAHNNVARGQEKAWVGIELEHWVSGDESECG